LGIIEDGAVLISDGLIREVGPARRLENLAESRQAIEINASGRVVLPGFVDSHTHLVSGPTRLLDFEMHLAGATPDEITAAGGGFGGIFRSIQDASARTLETQAWRVVQESIRQGTTTIEAKSGYGVTDAGELKILRAQAALNRRLRNVVSTFLSSRTFPENYQAQPADFIDWLIEHLLPTVKRRKLAEFADVYCEEDLFPVDLARKFLTAAKELGFGLKLHGGQFGNVGAARLAVELGATSFDHAIHLNAEDTALLAHSPVIVTLLPGPVFSLARQRYASARALIDRGAAVALATNYNPVTSPTTNMQMIMFLACRKMGMSPAEAVSAATINGAHALGRADRIGSIEFGKWADLIVLSVPDYREIPYHFGVNLVEMTMIRGEVIYHASEVQCPAV
jgi:imidazolonepropionase